MSGPGSPNDRRRAYVRAVIEAYVRSPITAARPRRDDRRLAADLHQRGVTFETVETALLLATVRRARRAAEAPPLPEIRSLHYFLPVIDEIRRDPPHAGYIEYLRDVAAEWLEEGAYSPDPPTNPGPARVPKTTFLHER